MTNTMRGPTHVQAWRLSQPPLHLSPGVLIGAVLYWRREGTFSCTVHCALALLDHMFTDLVEKASERDPTSDGALTWTLEEETKVRRKLDRCDCAAHHLPLPTMFPRSVRIVSIHAKLSADHLPRVNVGNARIQGMAVDLDLNRDFRFNWVTSIFYIVYMFVEVPSNILLKKLGPKYYLPLLVCGFGFVSLCSAFVHSFEGLLAARAFLGVFEGGVMP